MKTSKKNMKWTLAILLSICLFACKKEEKSDIVDAVKKEELTKRIAEIIPKKYQDTLAKLGITLNQDITPPNVEGAFAFKPVRLVKSNRPQDLPSMSFIDVSIKFFNQDKDNNIKLISKSLLNSADTSIVTAISGKDNVFTIYGKVKSVRGSDSAIFGVIISGSRDGNALRNIRYGLINIDNTKGGTSFIKEGEARVIFDTDQISETIPMF